MTPIAFPAHAGRGWPLPRWRSVARAGTTPTSASNTIRLGSFDAAARLVAQIVRGLRSDDWAGVERLVSGLRIVAIGRDEAERAGAWRRDFARRGVTLSQADCLVAAACANVGAVLATANVRDFPMSDLIVEEWPVGE